jgi:hypothetical protein
MRLPLSVVVEVPTQTQLVAQAALVAAVRITQAQEALCLVALVLLDKVTLVVLDMICQTKAVEAVAQVLAVITVTQVVTVAMVCNHQLTAHLPIEQAVVVVVTTTTLYKALAVLAD